MRASKFLDLVEKREAAALDDAPSNPVALEGLLNLFDLLLLVIGACDLLLRHLGFRRWWSLFLYLRLLRALRILRLFEDLRRLTGAMAGMLSSLAWIFSVMFVVVQVSSVALAIYAEDLDDADMQEHWSSVPASMFSLFQVTTMDDWMQIALPLMVRNRGWSIFFIFFIGFSSWMMLSLVTAVADDQMVQRTEVRKEAEKEEEAAARLEFIQFLQVCFRAADADGNELLDQEEFDELINDDVVTTKMAELGVQMSKQELHRSFSILDVDNSGELTIEEFTTGLSRMQESLTTQHVVSIDYAMQRMQVRLSTKVDSVVNRLRELQKLNVMVADAMGRVAGNIDGLRKDLVAYEQPVKPKMVWLQTMKRSWSSITSR